MKNEFVLPERWYLDFTTNDEDAQLIINYINPILKSDSVVEQDLWTINDCYKYRLHIYNDCYEGGNRHLRTDFTLVSIEDFKKYVLNQEPIIETIQDYTYLIPFLQKLNNK